MGGLRHGVGCDVDNEMEFGTGSNVPQGAAPANSQFINTGFLFAKAHLCDGRSSCGGRGCVKKLPNCISIIAGIRLGGDATDGWICGKISG
ncbi:uncharacterized protein AruCF_2660 [Achromobacter ruhlandii]|nr:uncharacterized protein AruCF_2660 [Achromobacter ruhlandii]